MGAVKNFDGDSKERIIHQATKQKSTVFNFTLEGQDGVIIHICCWQENMHLLEGKIRRTNVRITKPNFYFYYEMIF